MRRTRNHVLRWYGHDAETDESLDPAVRGLPGRQEEGVRAGEREQAILPKRRPRTITYRIEDSYGGLYDELRGYLGSGASGPTHVPHDEELTYARYGIGDYVLPARRDEKRYRELRQAGGTLRGLMRVLLFKRFESSVYYAFRETVRRLLAAHEALMVAVDAGIMPAGERAERILNSGDAGGDIEAEDNLVRALQLTSEAGTHDAADFNTARLLSDIRNDAGLLYRILSLVEPITPKKDAKLHKLKACLQEDGMREGKRLIFTQHADTALHLHENLNPKGTRNDIDVIFSGDKSKERAVGHFSAGSNPEYRFGPGDTELSTLIASDVLSEGLNMQDCNKIINYDLHWNPVRLIQRFGWIDRIGTSYDEIFGFNILPEIGIEENLGLREKLEQRIREIQRTIGEDVAILDPSEKVNAEAMYAIYEADGDAGEKLALLDEDSKGDEELIDLGEAVEMFRQMRDERPEEFGRIVSLRDGIRAARRFPASAPSQAESDKRSGAWGSAGKGTYVFCRAGGYQRLYKGR